MHPERVKCPARNSLRMPLTMAYSDNRDTWTTCVGLTCVMQARFDNGLESELMIGAGLCSDRSSDTRGVTV